MNPSIFLYVIYLSVVSGFISQSQRPHVLKPLRSTEVIVPTESVEVLMENAMNKLSKRFMEIDLRTKRHMNTLLTLFRVSFYRNFVTICDLQFNTL